ncbi:MAG: O-antigen ligase like rane protein [Herminiimonas sp.]|jgi:O-antigen ligase|nr:O-antigen ligase like rane protein [Herminiimonas sp.]
MNSISPAVLPQPGSEHPVFLYARTGTPGQGMLRRYGALSVVAILGLVFLNIPNYVNAINGGVLPKYFYYLFFALLGPLVLLKPKSLVAYLVSPFAVWALVVVILNLIHYFSAPVGTDVVKLKATNELVFTRIFQVVMAAGIGFAVSTLRTESYSFIFRILAVAIPFMLAVDFLTPGIFYLPGTEGSVPGRSAATFINPNIASESLLLAFLLACPLFGRYRLPMLLLMGVGIVLTFTRSAIIAWMLLWIYLSLWRIVPRTASGIVLFTMLAATPVLLAGFESYLGGRHDIVDIGNLQERLDFFLNANMNDYSAQERALVLQKGWDLFLSNPILGAGGGATRVWPLQASTHNQFVMLAAEYGVLGIAVWAALGIILWKGKYFRDRHMQHAMCFLYIYMTFFTHNMFDMTYWLAAFALVSGKHKY